MRDFIEEISLYIKEKGYNAYAVGVAEGTQEARGMQLQEVNPCQNSYSVAKAFTLTAIGMCFDKKMLTPESTAVDLLGEECPDNLAQAWNRVTVHMLLTHSAGLPGGCLDIDCLDARTFGEDYLDYLMHLPFIYAPGEGRAYSDGAFYLLARIAEHLLGENLTTYLWKTLFYPLGFREVAWSTCPKGHCMGATGLYIRSEDMVKLGAVYLNGGAYMGHRVVSEEWVKIALAAPYELSPVGVGNFYSKGGMHCQNLFVDPEGKRAVAYHGFDRVDGNDLMRFAAEFEK